MIPMPHLSAWDEQVVTTTNVIQQPGDVLQPLGALIRPLGIKENERERERESQTEGMRARCRVKEGVAERVTGGARKAERELNRAGQTGGA